MRDEFTFEDALDIAVNQGGDQPLKIMSAPIDVPAKVEPAQPTLALERSAPKAESFESLMLLAKELCTTGFLPQAVKTPAQAVAIILTGRELGLGPMQSLRSICIIQGKPELAADLQLSIFHRDGGRSKWLALTEQKAVLWLKHPNGDEHTETFTMEDARRAGLANGTNWSKYPKAMLRSRAITAGLKSIGFEPLSGAYAPGEIGGPEIVGPEPETIPEATTTAPKPAAPTTCALAPAATAKPATTQAGGPGLKPATTATRAWMMKELEPCEQLATEFFQKLAIGATNVLAPFEGLKDLGWEWIPITQTQMKLLKAAITDFGNGGAIVQPYPPNPVDPAVQKAKKAPAANPVSAPAAAARKRDPEWFFDVIVPIPRKGMKKVEYDKAPDTIGSLYKTVHEEDKDAADEARKRLFGFANHWKPEPRTVGDRTYQPTQAEILFREALDAFIEWHEKHGKDSNPAPDATAELFEQRKTQPEEDDVPF